jgi:hypothetical protein
VDLEERQRLGRFSVDEMLKEIGEVMDEALAAGRRIPLDSGELELWGRLHCWHEDASSLLGRVL